VITDFLLSDDKLIASTTDAGLWEWKWGADSVKVYSPSSGFPAKGAYVMKRIDGDIWCGTAFGVVRSISEGGPWLIMRDDDGRTDDGLYPVTALHDDVDGVWYGLLDQGLGRFSKVRIEWVPIYTGFTYDVVKAIGFMDNALWIGFGYLGSGVDLVDTSTNTFLINRGTNHQMTPERVTRITEDDKYGYVCGYEGLRIRKLSDGEETPLIMEHNGVSIRDVTGVIRYESLLWIATLGGLRKFDLNNNKLTDMTSCIKDGIMEMRIVADTVFAATLHSGVISFSAVTGEKFETVYFANKRIDALEIYAGSLWAQIFNEGLAVLDYKANNSYVIVEDNVLDSARVTVLEEMDGRLWIGTKNHGIVVRNSALNKWNNIDYRNGLINNEILCIRDKGSKVWIGLPGGMNSFERDSVYNAFK
jgi:ligand-binding sensor domain-containing protein